MNDQNIAIARIEEQLKYIRKILDGMASSNKDMKLYFDNKLQMNSRYIQEFEKEIEKKFAEREVVLGIQDNLKNINKVMFRLTIATIILWIINLLMFPKIPLMDVIGKLF